MTETGTPLRPSCRYSTLPPVMTAAVKRAAPKNETGLAPRHCKGSRGQTQAWGWCVTFVPYSTLEKMAEGKLRFGLFDIMQVLEQTSSQHAYAAHLKDAVVADEAGLDYYFVAERHFMPLYRSPAPSIWLAAVAAKT